MNGKDWLNPVCAKCGMDTCLGNPCWKEALGGSGVYDETQWCPPTFSDGTPVYDDSGCPLIGQCNCNNGWKQPEAWVQKQGEMDSIVAHVKARGMNRKRFVHYEGVAGIN